MTGRRSAAPVASRGQSAAAAIHVAIACFAATMAVGVWTAPDRAAALPQLWVLVAGGLAYGVIWAAARFVSGAFTALLVTFLLANVAAAAFFLAQYQYLAVGAKVPAVDALARALSAPFAQSDAWAPFPNSLATLLDGAIGAALGVVLSRRSAVLRGVGAVALAVLVAALLASASRGSWLGVAAALAAGTYVAWRLPAPSLGLAGPLAGVAVLAAVGGALWSSPPWWVRLVAAAGRPDRLEVYQHASTLLRDTPFTGIGAGGSFASSLSKYALMIQVPYLTYAHNLSLQIWLDQGVLGLAAWFALAAATVVAAAAGEAAQLGWRFRGVWVGLLAIHLHGLSDARQSVDGWTWAPFFVLSALLAAAVGRHGVRVTRARVAAPAMMAGLVVLAVVVGRGSVGPAWTANLAGVAQARADFAIDRQAAPIEQWRTEAVDGFSRVLDMDGTDVPALRRLGMLELDLDHHADAVTHLSRAYALDPGTASTRKAYGLAAMWTGDVGLAAQLLGGLPGIAEELNTWSYWRRSRDEVALAAAAARVSLAVEPDQAPIVEWLAGLEAERPATAR